MSTLVFRGWIGVVGLLLALWIAGCTRDRVEGMDLTIDLDPADVAAEATARAEATRSSQSVQDPLPITYVVQAGDNLATIASDHYISLDTLRQFNPQLQSDNLIPGDELLIPVVDPPSESSTIQETGDSETSFYVVQVGDTVFDLAMAFGITVNEIKAANPSIILDRIAVGQRLAMPKGAERVAEPTAEPEDPNALHHLVQAGENLGGIAALYDVDPLEIARINSLTSPDRLGIGQKLLLPKNATLLELPTEEPIGGESLVHTVAAGETLSSIALQYEVRLSDLVKANNLQNADQLALGQKIHVPGVAPRTPEGLRIHIVRAGETLHAIAELYQVPLLSLQIANNMVDSNKLAEGQELIVPKIPD